MVMEKWGVVEKSPELLKSALIIYIYWINSDIDQYLASNPQYGDYPYLEISFAKMMGTCAHELTHYLQLVQHGRSSCESDLKLNNGNYDEELSKEHEKEPLRFMGWLGIRNT